MKFTAVDIECNQPNDEVIQIGAACFDTDRGFKPVLEFNVWIDQEIPINWDYPLKPDGMTLGDLLPWDEDHFRKVAVSYDVGFQMFWDWFAGSGSGKKIFQWGQGDMRLIREQTPHDNFPKHTVFDVYSAYKFLFNPALNLEKGGLGAAMRGFGIDFTGKPHDALVDAVACGEVFCEMYKILRKFRDIERVMNE